MSSCLSWYVRESEYFNTSDLREREFLATCLWAAREPLQWWPYLSDGQFHSTGVPDNALIFEEAARFSRNGMLNYHERITPISVGKG